MIQAIIIDDERRSRESLKYLIENYTEDIEVIEVADDIDSGILAIKNNNPDLLFLDIKMKQGTGFDLLNQINEIDFQVIFTTAYNEYAIKAFKFNAIDYLLKPIDSDELKRAVEKVKKWIDTENERKVPSSVEAIKSFNPKDPKIAIPSRESYDFVKVSDIVRIEADGAYANVVLHSGKSLLTSRLLKDFESLLIDYGFYRVHHSHLINLEFIDKYIKSDGGYIVMEGNAQIPISRRKKDHFIKEHVKKML